ncbi:hypothetical protein CEXT_794081 [Caerostris extrusa]|uniref:Uncharacterized protein n=1 Tax=Caerostris extrusa TaxID=172846 RepID=A0AAV4RJD2_CAEEX|nr:hypothetical protein CEXT_794081 [Caerostris extrusa]
MLILKHCNDTALMFSMLYVGHLTSWNLENNGTKDGAKPSTFQRREVLKVKGRSCSPSIHWRRTVLAKRLAFTNLIIRDWHL